MKSKPRKPDPDLEQDDDAVDIESKSPAVAAAKKSKMLVIVASSILITVVVYMLFFKGDSGTEQKLEEVAVPSPTNVAPGKSPFEIEEPEKKSPEVELLAKPAIPDVPTLPDLPEGVVPQDQNAFLPTQDQQAQNQQPGQVVLPTQTPPGAPVAVAPAATNPTAPQAETQPDKKEIDPRYAPIIVFSGGDIGPSRGVGHDKNIVKLNENDVDSLKKTESTVVATYISDRPHTIAQGKMITAILETAINTEIPGSVRGIVSRDVYGESGKEVLIPRGSRLFGSYTSKVVRGQGRVEIGWKRLIRPDGVDLAISFNASDQFGRSGISGEIDNKYGSVITNSILTSVLAIGAVAAAQSLFSDQTQSNTTTVNPAQGTTTTTGSATNQAIYDVSKTITDTVGKIVGNTLDIDPVIRVPQGTKITVIVNADIKVPYISGKK